MLEFGYNANEFQQIIARLPEHDVVQQYFFDLFPFCFKENQEVYWELRQQVCSKFDIHPRNFVVIGSAKLGFSAAPDKFGKPFGDDSDIDIVIVSDLLFEKIWLKLLNYRESSYYKLNFTSKQKFNDLQRILFFGQIRMDKLSNSFDFAKTYWTFFNELSIDPKYGPRQIRSAIFKSWTHVSSYYEKSLRDLKKRALK